MRTSLHLLLTTALAFSIFGCSTPEERRKRDAQYAREDARRDAEDRKKDAVYEEERWQDFLTDYAHRLGKSKSELTSAQRAEARQAYRSDEGRYGRGYGYGYGHYHGWYY